MTHLFKVIDEKFSINDIDFDTIFHFQIKLQKIVSIFQKQLSQNYTKQNSKIIYSYFIEKDKEIFENQHYKHITFKNDMTEKVKNIS